jgi:hypothetical protein
VAGIEVDPGAVVATAGSLRPLAADVSGPGERVGRVPALAEAPLASALESMKTAWSTALRLLGQDVGICADKVGKAAVTYSTTEHDIHNAFATAAGAKVDFTPPKPPTGGRRAI